MPTSVAKLPVEWPPKKLFITEKIIRTSDETLTQDLKRLDFLSWSPLPLAKFMKLLHYLSAVKTMEFPDPKYRDICNRETLHSFKRGFFSELSSMVVEKVGNHWINGVFAQEKKEEDKVRACCMDTRVWGIMQEHLKNIKPVYREKSASVAKDSRIEGEELFNRKDYKKAVLMLSQSIIRAPKLGVDHSVDNGLTLPLGYKSRAYVLYQLQLYKECLVDLRMSIKEGVPNDAKHEVYRLMGQCHEELNDVKKAKICFELARKMLQDRMATSGKANLPRRSQMKCKTSASTLKKEKEEIEKILLKLNNGNNLTKITEPRPPSTERYPLPVVTGSINNNYPNASKLVTVVRTADAGRFTTAADDISTGDTLVVEEPYASYLIPEKFSSRCHHCYSRLDTPIPCNICSGLAFCSTECRDAASSTYHKYECPFIGLFIGSGMSVLSFLALRMVTQEKIQFFKQLQEKIKENPSPPQFTDKEINYMNIYQLVTHSAMRPNEDYFKRTFMAIFLVKCLKKTDFFGNENTKEDEELSEDEILTASLILRHLQLLQFNAHEIYETRVEKPGKTLGSKSEYIGVGLYPTVALFNHECSPTVARYFHGRNIVIKAVRPIKKGNIVSENYGPVFAKRSLHERQRELASRYWFKCKCDACLEDWPKLEHLSEENLRLRCKTEGCSGLLKHPLSSEKAHMERMCQVCYNKINLSDEVKKVSRLEYLFHKGIEHMENERCEKAVPLLKAYLDEIFKLGAPPSREISLCQEALRTCYSQTGNIWVCD